MRVCCEFLQLLLEAAEKSYITDQSLDAAFEYRAGDIKISSITAADIQPVWKSEEHAHEDMQVRYPYLNLLILFLPTCSLKSNWNRAQHKDRSASGRAREANYTITRASSRNDEAFMMLCLLNYWKSWWHEFRDETPKHERKRGRKPKSTSDSQAPKPLYTADGNGGGNKSCHGWRHDAFPVLNHFQTSLEKDRKEHGRYFDKLYGKYQRACIRGNQSESSTNGYISNDEEDTKSTSKKWCAAPELVLQWEPETFTEI